MNIKSTLRSLCITAVVFVFTSSVSWAAATECTEKKVGTGVKTAKIAVASNFFTAAKDLVTAFQKTTAGANTAITICENSTTHLLAEIKNGTELPPSVFPTDPGFPRYNLFLAANAAAPNSLQSSTGTISYTYAIGIPVFFGLRTKVPTVGDLITGLGSGYSATITASTSELSPYAVNKVTAPYVALAGTGAPYGVMSHTILNAMEGTHIPSVLPSWVYSTLFANIDLTYDAVIAGTGGIRSGFVSKGQICGQLGSVTYVEFTDSTCELDQKAILLKKSNGSPNATAAALNNYIQGRITNGTWDTFLSAHCYGTF
ncbi:MAG TPA: hypothetical protein VFG19_03885 [Geobacteraceae bacterium]|nr:hypothetical protein [Geobacteraceae bacterium]